MAITENPNRNTNKDAKAERFIAEAGQLKDDVRKPIMLRIPANLLARIDKGAKRLGLTRTSFIISGVAEKLERMDG